ncbi:MAG: PAS domain S-box protein, partial [Calditrichaceae bacterium]
MYIKIKNELEKKTGLKKLLTSSEPSQKRLRKYARRILYIWTILIFISLIVNYRFQREEIHNVSELVARTYFDNSHELRKWISMHDKLFEKLKHNRIFKPDSLISNNYNSHEIQKLQALLPDSYSMMKEIFNTKSDVFGVQIHITSLHCIDSENKPDVWETKALKSFRGGKKEAFEFVSNGGEEVLRMMQPMKVEKSCLNCHTNEQYQVDDIRGGFSIAVPLKPFYAATGYQNSMVLWNRLGVWLLGIGVIIFFLIRESVRIEEKNRNQRRQKETNQTLQALIKSSPSAIIAVDMQGYVMLWNPAAEKMFGWSAEEAIDNFHPSLTAEERAGFVEHLKKQAKGESSRMEIKRRRKDGQMIDVWLSTAPLKDCEGQITGVIGVLEDITDQKQAETSYKENMQKYQILFDQSLDGIYLHDCEGKIIDVNNAAIAQVGYSKDELISMSVFDLLSKETNRREIRKNWQECPVNQPFIVEDRHRHKNGGFYPVEIKSGKVLFGDKELMLAIVRDITERKKRDEEFKTLINGMNDTAFVIGFEGKFLEVNDSALDTLGYSRSELLIMGPSDIDPNLKDSEIKDLIERMPGDKIQVFETKHRKKDGNDIPVEISSSLVTYRGEAAILSVARDITERKQVEQELQHSRDQLVEAQKITKIGHYVLDINSGQWTCSASLDDIFGLDADFMKDVAGWKNIIHPEDRDMMLAYLNDSVIELRQPFDKEYRIVNLKTGEVKWIHGFGSLKFDENNIPMEMFGTIQDITERKTAEEALRISEERYRKVLNRVREIIFETDAEGNWTFLNPAWKKITGYDITESIGKSFLEYIHPDDRKLTMAKFEPLIKKKTEFYRHQVRYLSKTGDTIWMEVHVTLIINEDGSLAGATGTLNDITERKKVEQALADSEERFRVLVQAAAQAVWETNSSGMVLNDSPTWRNYTGQSRKEFIGYGWRNAIHPGDRESVDRQWFKAIASGRDHYIEYRIHSQDGEWRWTNEIAAPVRDENGRIIKWVGMNLDITNRKNIENELRKSEERLELALQGADLGLWDWNIKTGRVIYNKQWAEMLGFSLAELDPNLETWQDLIHPDDLPVAMKKLERHLKGKIPIYEAEYRMRTKQG